MHDGHRDRVKNRFLKEGLDNFEPHNALEMLLFYSVPRKDTNELAHLLINTFGSYTAVIDASFEQLIKVKGVTENTAILIKMILPYSRFYETCKITEDKVFLNSPESVGEYLYRRYIGYTEEVVTLVCLDHSCRVLACEVIGRGDIASASISMRVIVEIVIKNKATGVILAHNHPGGIALPSQSDVETTRRVFSVLNDVGVYLMDHIILCSDDYVSMASSVEYENIFTQRNNISGTGPIDNHGK